jgi:two-component system cell cycle sensor histidine kinase/response regulator CckA
MGPEHSEEQRLSAAARYARIEEADAAGFDQITELAARLLGAPVCILAVVDRSRLLLKSRYGLSLPVAPREGSFCSTAVQSDQVTVVPDARLDPRFAGRTVSMGGLAVRFYAGAPLVSPEGYSIGTLAVMDTHPRTSLADEQISALRDLAVVAMHQMNLVLRAGLPVDQGEPDRGETMFRAVMQSATQAIIAVDRDGRIRLVNRRTEDMFGYAESEVIGQQIEMLLPESFRESHTKHRATYFDQPHPRPMGIGMQLAGRRKNGKQFPVEISLNHVMVEGEPLAISFVSNIGERVRLEEQLRQSHKMDAVGQLAGGVAHDFNNLLTVIQGFSAMGLEDMEPDHPLHEPLQEIEKAAMSAAALTRQLLAFSRQQVVRPRILELNGLISNVEKMLRRVIGEDIELIVQYGENLGRVRGDAGSIEQILMNLALNARDAMPNGGHLIIETGSLFLDEQYADTHLSVKAGRYAMLAVGDSGTGMTPEVRAHIFEPFFTTKPAGQGTGLGLATVYGIVRQMEGGIWVYSEQGKGTTFKILFPIVQAGEEAERDTEAAVMAVPTGSTILLVEDESGVRRFVRAILEKQGYTVLEAGNPESALAIAAESPRIDLLLTDVVMPKLNGPELAERILAVRPNLKVLFMSGYTDRAVRLQDRMPPEAAFIQKPFTPKVLAAKIQDVLGMGGTAAH